MLEEPRVLGRHDRLLDVRRDLADRGVLAMFLVERREQRPAVRGVQVGGLRLRVHVQVARQPVDQVGPGLGAQTADRGDGIRHRRGHDAGDEAGADEGHEAGNR
jgi:hypothetical protein